VKKKKNNDCREGTKGKKAPQGAGLAVAIAYALGVHKKRKKSWFIRKGRLPGRQRVRLKNRRVEKREAVMPKTP